MNKVLEALNETYNYSITYREEFWDKIAKDLFWFKQYDKVFDDSEFPYVKWFKGGKINITYNALDLKKSDKIALFWENENGDRKSFTYAELYEKVSSFSSSLKQLGVKRGDVVTIYMPMIPEAMISMLSVARIGGIHNVVFAGFGEQALRERIVSSESKFVITADIGYRRGKEINYIDTVKNAINGLEVNVITVPRSDKILGYNFYDLLDSKRSEAEDTNSEDPLFILYTSGTTGKPKGVVHAMGAYTVWAYFHVKWLFNFNQNSVFFSTPDIGWINGHSYSTYGPLLNNTTLLWYEGVPDYPDNLVWWRLIEKYKVTDVWVAPTAIRLLMKYSNTSLKDFDLSRLRMIVSAGEILGEKAWKWLSDLTDNRVYVIETWGQTENSGFITSPGGFLIGGIYYKKGSVGHGLPGIDIAIYDENCNELPPYSKGSIVVKSSAPAFMSSVWKDDKRFRKYYEKCGVYFTGDYGFMDNDGYLYILGREDDVIKVAGHRISPAEIENMVLQIPSISDVAVIGKSDEIRGNVLVVFVSLKQGYTWSQDLENEIKDTIYKNFGKIAIIDKIYFVNKLPKTRTGKIMRRALRALVNGNELGDLSTLEEKEAIEELKSLIGDQIGK
ncbi:acetate--CoA ligase [Acidianus sulfidivorans JP7]|uniref:Acetyl-CoA synthetase n=1 Tax=Acidianus sulfidivorans JP7 TaxID=619593 RepID=A0A2U9IN14_9CREN|nr:acetate--CoA ligase [Acidianus sulfidivorans]AWR97400.1 acetate--CoA ligase [Acidianus sulfidivorans JP7]